VGRTPQGISLRGNSTSNGSRKNPPNPSFASEEDFYYDSRKFVHRRIRTRDLGHAIELVFHWTTRLLANIMSAGGKQLELLIGLISKICDVIRVHSVLELQLQTNGSRLVQKLVDTLNSNRKPNPEYPRMRRAVVELLISVLESCPHYATIFGRGMMEALTKVERTPSEVEKYRVFYGNIGIVPDSGPPLTALVAKAKELIHSAAPTLGA